MHAETMGYKWILFDADNTLFDYAHAEATAIRNTFEESGIPFTPGYIETYREINRQIWIDFEKGRISQRRLRVRRFQLLSEAVAVNFDPIRFNDIYLKHLSQNAALLTGVEETLKRLYPKIGMAVLTNGLTEVQRRRLDRSAIRPYIFDIVVSEDVGAAKPDPMIFDLAFERIGNPARKDVLMVGDGLATDIKGGNDYGLDTCWFNPHGQPGDEAIAPRYEITRFGEIIDIIENRAVKP